MDGWDGGGERRPVELHSLQIVKELSSFQRSTVYFTSSQQAAPASPFCLTAVESKHIYKLEVLVLYLNSSILNLFIVQRQILYCAAMLAGWLQSWFGSD